MADDSTDDPPKGVQLKWTDPNHDRHKRSLKHEQRIAKDHGGKRLPNSGAKSRSKWTKVAKVTDVAFTEPAPKKSGSESFERVTLDGDLRTKGFHIEHKRTVHASISFQKDWWEKVAQGAFAFETQPVIALTFESKQLGAPPLDLFVISKELFEKFRLWYESNPDLDPDVADSSDAP